MPTENRSSNTDESTEPSACPFCDQNDAFVEQLDSDASVVICQGRIDEHSACLARGPVGVQEHECEGQPGHDQAVKEWNKRAAAVPHPEPIAWMVGTAIWWTKEEAERDAAATGKKIIPFGPITEVGKPADQLHAEPVAWLVNGADHCNAYIQDPKDWAQGYEVLPLYTRADPGELDWRAVAAERLELVRRWRDRWAGQENKANDLERRLAERDALLHRWVGNFGHLGGCATPLRDETKAALSASAEPEAPGKQGSPLEAVPAKEIQDLPDRAAAAIGQYGDSLLGRGQREDSVDLLDLEREVRDLEQEFRGIFALPGA